MLLEELLQRKKEEGIEEGRKEGRKEGIEEGRKEGIEEGRKEGTLNHAQNVLIRILESKNPILPDSLIEQITNTKDIEELNRMFDLALEADSIETFTEKLTVN